MVEQAAGNYGKATALRTLARERRWVQHKARNAIAEAKGTLQDMPAETEAGMAPMLQGS
jgi:hypothetical protein